jgi:hypothetical protein
MTASFAKVKIVFVFKDDFIFQMDAELCLKTGELFFKDFEVEKSGLKEEYIIFPSQEKRNVCKHCHKFLEKTCEADTCVHNAFLSKDKKQNSFSVQENKNEIQK